MFDYQTSRAGAHARAPAWPARPYEVDDYVGYKALFADGPTELACLAHIRRKFFDVHAASGSPVADEALRRIAALYAIEQQGAGLDPPQRLALRQRLAMPALAQLHAWLLATQRAVAVSSGTAKAVDHALRRWSAMPARARCRSITTLSKTPYVPLPSAKKNWLFTGSERAGHRAAAIQSMFATAKLNGIDPVRWLANVLERLPTCPNNQIDSLLPFPDFIQT